MTDDATKMKQERDLALAECKRLRNAYDAAHNQAMANGQARDRAIDECERLRAALKEFISIVGTAAGFETAMAESDEVFTEFLNKQQARVDSAVENARELLDAARAKP